MPIIEDVKRLKRATYRIARSIFNSDGKLTSDRKIDLNRKNLHFCGETDFIIKGREGKIGIGTDDPQGAVDIVGNISTTAAAPITGGTTGLTITDDILGTGSGASLLTLYTGDEEIAVGVSEVLGPGPVGVITLSDPNDGNKGGYVRVTKGATTLYSTLNTQNETAATGASILLTNDLSGTAYGAINYKDVTDNHEALVSVRKDSFGEELSEVTLAGNVVRITKASLTTTDTDTLLRMDSRDNYPVGPASPPQFGDIILLKDHTTDADGYYSYNGTIWVVMVDLS